MKFKSHNFWCKCLTCGNEFQTLSGASLDGIHLLLSKKDNLPALVICDDDVALKEVWAIAERILFPQELFESEIARRIGLIYGEFCDLAPDLTNYDMSGKRRCSKCGSSSVDYGPTDPPVFEEAEAPIVRHTKWDGMSSENKMAWVKSLLEAYR